MKDYADAVRRLYEQRRDSTRQLTEQMAVGAAVMVARHFPPANADEALQVLVALNLLNAFVKQPDGGLIVTYRYIKGMATQLLIFLLERPIEGVEVYMNTSEGISYFRALGVQISFHYLPFYRRLVRLLPIATANPQSWDGLRLQEVAAEMMARFCPEAQDFTPEEAVKARWSMLHYRPKSADRPQKEQSPASLAARSLLKSRAKARGRRRVNSGSADSNETAGCRSTSPRSSWRIGGSRFRRHSRSAPGRCGASCSTVGRTIALRPSSFTTAPTITR